jgi:hypothetical protein
MSRTNQRFFLLCVAIIAAVVVLIFFAGCGNDAKIEQRDTAPANVINFPDGFASVAHKCDSRGHRVYSVGGDDVGVAVAVIEDPTCR